MKHAMHDASGVFATDERGDILLLIHRGSNDPATDLDSSEGYAKGCIAINANSSDESDLLYANIGDNSSANFNLVTVAGD